MRNVNFIILIIILEDELKPKERILNLYLLPLNSYEQKFLLSLCTGIEKKVLDNSKDAIKYLGSMTFLWYL